MLTQRSIQVSRSSKQKKAQGKHIISQYMHRNDITKSSSQTLDDSENKDTAYGK